MQDRQPFQERMRDQPWLAVAEGVVAAGLFWADVHHHIYVSKTPYLFLLGWASLRMRGMRWKDVGFARPRGWGKALLVGILAGVCMEAIELFGTQPLLAKWLGKMPDLSDFTEVRGNLQVLLLFLLLTWTLAAFGEELVYRGYLMNRVAGLFLDRQIAWLVSLVVVSVFFGCSHIDQGSTGMIENIWDGLLLGGLYLACGRNLAVPIIAHGMTDTLDFVLIYLGRYPGIH